MHVCVCVSKIQIIETLLTDRRRDRKTRKNKKHQKNNTTAEQKDAGRKTEIPSDPQKVLTGYIINTYNNGS